MHRAPHKDTKLTFTFSLELMSYILYIVSKSEDRVASFLVNCAMRRYLVPCLVMLLLTSLTTQENNTLHYINKEDREVVHYLVKWKAWHLTTFFGLFGIFSNLFLLYTFYVERQYLASSVNTMICMDTLYRFVYSTFAIHWRNYNMTHQEGLLSMFWSREKVCSKISMTMVYLT